MAVSSVDHQPESTVMNKAMIPSLLVKLMHPVIHSKKPQRLFRLSLRQGWAKMAFSNSS